MYKLNLFKKALICHIFLVIYEGFKMVSNLIAINLVQHLGSVMVRKCFYIIEEGF